MKIKPEIFLNSQKNIVFNKILVTGSDESFIAYVKDYIIKDFEKSLIAYMNSEYKELMDKVSETGEYGDDIQSAFTEALDKLMETQTW